MALTWELDPSCSDWVSDTTPVSRAGMPERSYIYLTVDENTTYAAREGLLRVTGEGGQTREITVAQLQNDAILVDADTYPVEPEGGVITVQVDANVDYTVEIPAEAASWCRHTSSEESAGEGPLRRTVETFEVDEASMTRNAVVVLRAVEGGATANVNISQIVESDAPIVDVPDEAFRNFLLQKGYVVAADGTKCQLTDAGMELQEMDCSGLKIESLKGIEGFTELVSLNFTNNMVKEVDLSANTKLSDLKFETNPVELMNLGDAPVMLVDISGTKLQVGEKWWEMVYPPKFTLISSQRQLRLHEVRHDAGAQPQAHRRFVHYLCRLYSLPEAGRALRGCGLPRHDVVRGNRVGGLMVFRPDLQGAGVRSSAGRPLFFRRRGAGWRHCGIVA